MFSCQMLVITKYSLHTLGVQREPKPRTRCMQCEGMWITDHPNLPCNTSLQQRTYMDIVLFPSFIYSWGISVSTLKVRLCLCTTDRNDYRGGVGALCSHTDQVSTPEWCTHTKGHRHFPWEGTSSLQLILHFWE